MMDDEFADAFAPSEDILVEHMHCFFCWRTIPLDFDEEGNQVTKVAYAQSALPMMSAAPPTIIGEAAKPTIGFQPHNVPICEKCRAPHTHPKKSNLLVPKFGGMPS